MYALRMNTANRARGNHTRQSLIRAATRVFGQVGFDGASTRAIAEAAGANQALINYHFGGKDGLYQAVITEFVEQMSALLEPALDRVSAAMPLEGKAAVDALVSVCAAMVDQFSREEIRDWSRIIAREQQDPTPAFELIYGRFMVRVLGLFAALVSGASGGALKEEAARVRAILLIGQIMVFVYAPAAAERFLGWSAVGDNQKQYIIREIGAMLERQFLEAE